MEQRQVESGYALGTMAMVILSVMPEEYWHQIRVRAAPAKSML